MEATQLNRMWNAVKVGALTSAAIAWTAARASHGYQVRHFTLTLPGRALRSIAPVPTGARANRTKSAATACATSLTAATAPFGVAGTPGFPGLRILHLSDTHFYRGREDLVAWLNRLATRAGIDYDMVVVTGDMLSTEFGDKHLVEHGLQPFIDSGIPGAYVFGDHDFFATRPGNPLRYLWKTTATPGTMESGKAKRLGGDNPTRLQRMLADSHWLDLNNAHGEFDVRGVRVELSGVNDPHGGRDRYVGFGAAVSPESIVSGGASNGQDASTTSTARAGETGGNPAQSGQGEQRGLSSDYLRATGRSLRFGLAHAPYARVLDEFLSDGTDLVFCGHTHGGQVCLPGGHALVTNSDLPPAYASGLFEWHAVSATGEARDSRSRNHGQRSGNNRVADQGKTMAVSVSPGLGTSPFTPWRVFCPPAAYIVELVASEAEAI